MKRILENWSKFIKESDYDQGGVYFKPPSAKHLAGLVSRIEFNRENPHLALRVLKYKEEEKINELLKLGIIQKVIWMNPEGESIILPDETGVSNFDPRGFLRLNEDMVPMLSKEIQSILVDYEIVLGDEETFETSMYTSPSLKIKKYKDKRKIADLSAELKVDAEGRFFGNRKHDSVNLNSHVDDDYYDLWATDKDFWGR